MLGIMLAMTPGFFIWKLYNRWLERKLAVTGKYYEDEYYANFEKQQAEKKRQARVQEDNRRDGANRHESSDMDSGNSEGGEGGGDDGVVPAELDELSESSASLTEDESRKLETILDIPVNISMEVGRSKISIRNLLQLNQGSVVELDRVAGEPLDVLVNGTLIAHGEVVVVNDKFGIRLTDVISQIERIKKLR
mgnify:CR=1 FL=1